MAGWLIPLYLWPPRRHTIQDPERIGWVVLHAAHSFALLRKNAESSHSKSRLLERLTDCVAADPSGTLARALFNIMSAALVVPQERASDAIDLIVERWNEWINEQGGHTLMC
jgi:hypothetical protein